MLVQNIVRDYFHRLVGLPVSRSDRIDVNAKLVLAVGKSAQSLLHLLGEQHRVVFSSGQIPIILMINVLSDCLFAHNEALKNKPASFEEVLDQFFIEWEELPLSLRPLALVFEAVFLRKIIELSVKVSAALPLNPKAPEAVVRRAMNSRFIASN